MTPDDQAPAAAILARAIALHQAGRLDEAERDYLAVAARDYRRLDVIRLLAGLAQEDGRIELALSRWQTLLDALPRDAPALVASGTLLHRQRRWAAAVERFRAAALARPDDPDILANLGVALTDAGRLDEAYALFRDAATRWPDAPLFRHRRRDLATALVPSWHIPMLNDAPRNQAFEAAIARAVAERGVAAHVLDVGAGSGLLSMMAARAGARAITACEMVPVIAETARRIVAANRYADRIKVIAKRSTDLQLGADLDRPADILVSEILSSSVLSEGVLASFEDAKRRLLKPAAAIIPRAVTAVGCLAGGAALEPLALVDRAAGFDLSLFGELAPPRIPVYGFAPPWSRLTADHDLVEFDLTAAEHPPSTAWITLTVTADGVALGVMQWMRVQLDATAVFANPPESYAAGGWQQVLHTFPKPVPVVAGQRLRLRAGHDRSNLIFAAE